MCVTVSVRVSMSTSVRVAVCECESIRECTGLRLYDILRV